MVSACSDAATPIRGSIRIRSRPTPRRWPCRCCPERSTVTPPRASVQEKVSGIPAGLDPAVVPAADEDVLATGPPRRTSPTRKVPPTSSPRRSAPPYSLSVAAAAVEHVGADAAADQVLAAAPRDDVVTAAADDHVGAGRADQPVAPLVPTIVAVSPWQLGVRAEAGGPTRQEGSQEHGRGGESQGTHWGDPPKQAPRGCSSWVVARSGRIGRPSGRARHHLEVNPGRAQSQGTAQRVATDRRPGPRRRRSGSTRPGRPTGRCRRGRVRRSG